PTPPILAVGEIRDLTTSHAVGFGQIVGDLLATSLAGLATIDVVAPSRVLELLPTARSGSRREYLEAARRANAVELVEGEVSETADHQLRLDLRRVRLSTGVVSRGYRFTAPDRWQLVD